MCQHSLQFGLCGCKAMNNALNAAKFFKNGPKIVKSIANMKNHRHHVFEKGVVQPIEGTLFPKHDQPVPAKA